MALLSFERLLKILQTILNVLVAAIGVLGTDGDNKQEVVDNLDD